MDISFIILAWNSRKYLEQCHRCIAHALSHKQLSYEILVLDNGSTDGTANLLARLADLDPEHVFPSYEPVNLGTTRSRNLLCRSARGEYLCIMDSDVELSDGVLEALIPMLKANDQWGVVVPRVIYPSGMWQKSFDKFPTLLNKIDRFIRLRQIEARQAQELRHNVEPFSVDYAISAFWLVRRSLYAALGGLDEKIFYAPEDVDFCLRVWRSGHSVVYVPSVTVVHHTQEISRGIALNRAKLNHVKGLLYYFLKHRYFLRRPSFAVAEKAPIDGKPSHAG